MTLVSTQHCVNTTLAYQLEDVITILSELEESHDKLCDIRSEMLFGVGPWELIQHRMTSTLRRNPLIPVLVLLYTIFAIVLLKTKA